MLESIQQTRNVRARSADTYSTIRCHYFIHVNKQNPMLVKLVTLIQLISSIIAKKPTITKSPNIVQNKLTNNRIPRAMHAQHD